MRKLFVFLSIGLALAACGGSSALSLVRRPDESGDAKEALHGLGVRVFEALRSGEPDRLLFDDLSIRELLLPEAANKVLQLKASQHQRLGRVEHVLQFNLRNADFLGVCAQGVHNEYGHGPTGLQHDAWVIERLLIVGKDPRVGAVASWVEGAFVYTNRGFSALSLSRVEAPRPGHSDLELATCELSYSWDLVQSVGGATH